mmetsp:Transcript_55838/g.83195  ORF Transcript_55838/g.83195 Transcript_55838/m.83195 type:complete len:88 (-) Transcript_55838:19-282(-)
MPALQPSSAAALSTYSDFSSNLQALSCFLHTTISKEILPQQLPLHSLPPLPPTLSPRQKLMSKARRVVESFIKRKKYQGILSNLDGC